MKAKKIDVHLILSQNKNEEWFDECMDSLKDEPIDIHFVDHIDNNIGLARLNGLLQGENKYASFIDPDDILVPGTFQHALDILNSGKCNTYYTNHHVMDENKNVYGKWFDKVAKPVGFSQAKQMHHVTIYDRNTIEDAYDFMDGIVDSEKKILNYYAIKNGSVYSDGHMGHYWRVHSGGVHNRLNITNNPEWWLDKVKELEKELLNRHKH